MYFIYIYILIVDPKTPQNPPYFLHLKPKKMPPCPLLDQTFTISLRIMTLPKFFNFWNVDTPKPENAEKTDQADQIVQTDHLTGHATYQTFFHI